MKNKGNKRICLIFLQVYAKFGRTSFGELLFLIIYVKKPFKNCNNTFRNLIMEEWWKKEKALKI